MKRNILIGLCVAGLAIGGIKLFAATLQTAGTQETKPTGLQNLVSIINANDVALNEDIAALQATESGGALAEGKILIGGTNGQAQAQTPAGDVTVSVAGATAIGANKVLESMLKFVDTAADEDFMSYEATTGDFEWHSANELAAKITTGLDGEAIGNDTIDDDSIDFADVTGADLTLTDCTAVTASGLVKGGTIGIGDGVLARTGTALVWIEAGVTNVLDAAVGTP